MLSFGRHPSLADCRIFQALTPGKGPRHARTPPAKKKARPESKGHRVLSSLIAARMWFSSYGFRGATLDQICTEAGLQPNQSILYYFSGKKKFHTTLLSQLMETGWTLCRARRPR